jgi:hypothetical protein
MSSGKRKRGEGRLAPNRGVSYMGATVRVGQRQQQHNAATWLERMQAAAAKQRELAK